MGRACFIRYAALGAFALASPGLAQKLSKAERAVMALTPEQISHGMEIKGIDALSPDLWVSSHPLLPNPYGSDRFFRAKINKATKAVTYQLYMVIQLRGDPFRPDRLTFLRDGKLQERKIERVDIDFNCYSASCSSTEDAVATLERADIEEFAKGALAGVDGNWNAKVFGRYADGAPMIGFKTEAAGFLIAVDRRLQKIQ